MGHARSMTEDRLRKIKDAGCWFIELGIESGNDEILKSIKKGTTKSKIAEAVRLSKKVGLKTKGNFIFGFPGETAETLEETTRFALDIKIDYFQQNFLTVWPGCEIFADVSNNSGSYEYYDSNWQSLAHQRISFIPKCLSKNELLKASKKAFRRFYLRPRTILIMLPMTTSKRGIIFIYKAFGAFLKTIFRNN